jgi:hypothetical protein
MGRPAVVAVGVIASALALSLAAQQGPPTSRAAARRGDGRTGVTAPPSGQAPSPGRPAARHSRDKFVTDHRTATSVIWEHVVGDLRTTLSLISGHSESALTTTTTYLEDGHRFRPRSRQFGGGTEG